MTQVIIGVDPHKLSATIDAVDEHERKLGQGRFTTDRVGYAAMRTHAKVWPSRTWAVEGAKGTEVPLAQRLLSDGEDVVDVPAKLAARLRLSTPDTNGTLGSRPARVRLPPDTDLIMSAAVVIGWFILCSTLTAVGYRRELERERG